MPQTYSFNPKQSLTIDAPIRNFTVEQGSVTVSKHDEVIPTTVEAGESFSGDDRAGLDLFSPDSATLTVLFTDEAKLEEEGRRPGEGEPRGKRRRRAKKAAKRKGTTPARSTASRGDAGGTGGSFESRTVPELRKLAKQRGLTVKGKNGKRPAKADFIAALREERG